MAISKIKTLNKDNVKVIGTLSDGTEITDGAVLEGTPNFVEPLVTISIESGRKLAAEITAFFKTIFHDYAGTRIIPATMKNGQTTLIVEAFFSDNPEEPAEGKIKNLINKQKGDVNRRSFTSVMNALDNKQAGATFELNDVTKQLLADMCYGGLAANTPANPKSASNWKKWVQESREQLITNNAFFGRPVFGGKEIVNVKFTGLNLNAIIKKIRGGQFYSVSSKDESNVEFNSTNAFYQAVYAGPDKDGDLKIILQQGNEQLIKELALKNSPMIAPYAYQNSVIVY